MIFYFCFDTFMFAFVSIILKKSRINKSLNKVVDSKKIEFLRKLLFGRSRSQPLAYV